MTAPQRALTGFISLSTHYCYLSLQVFNSQTQTKTKNEQTNASHVFWHLRLDSQFGFLQTVIHAQCALQLLDNALVKGYLLREVGLHHVFEVHLSLPMEVAHLCLEGEADCPAAFPNAIRLILVHLALVTHPLALLHLGKGTFL